MKAAERPRPSAGGFLVGKRPHAVGQLSPARLLSLRGATTDARAWRCHLPPATRDASPEACDACPFVPGGGPAREGPDPRLPR